MFSGKTVELIRRVRAAHAAGHAAAAIKPAADSRSGGARLTTHDGQSHHAHEAAAPAEVELLAGAAPIVAIDEAHFFGAALAPVCERLVAAGRRVIVAGVHLDHRGEPFEPFPRLLCLADEVMKLACPCAVCGRPAIHSHRKAGADGRIVVGGADLYEPRCRACFVRR